MLDQICHPGQWPTNILYYCVLHLVLYTLLLELGHNND